MADQPDIWVIITARGRPIAHKAEHAYLNTYWGVLSAIYAEYRTAGSGWDNPNMLLKNGKIVVPDKLSDLAWKYGKDLQANQEEAKKLTQEKHWPAWMEKELVL